MTTEVVPGKIFTVDNFLSDLECQEYIQLINERRLDGNHRSFVNVGDFYNEKFIDDHLTTIFTEKLRKYLDFVHKCSRFTAIAFYQDKQFFGIHTDTGIIDKWDNTESTHTVLIYLNDDYEGGFTTFYNEKFQKLVSIEPKKGTALIFDINMYHMADPISVNEYHLGKYWIGTEIMQK